MSYYTSIIILCVLALGVLCVLLRENDRISREHKRIFYLTYLLIAASALAEWVGIQLNGNASLPRWPLQVAKCADYILTPLAGGALVGQMRLKNGGRKLLYGVLAGNALFQIMSGFFGWVTVIDSQNHYTHGPLYTVYILVYLTVLTLVVMEFILYGKSFRRQNRPSLYAIMILVIVGIAMQEFLGSDHRTAYISLTLGAALMFIHFSEFSQLASDDYILEQQLQLSTDTLTGLHSRHAYSEALKDYAVKERIPANLVAFVIDINDLKSVNDTMGHDAGDELICGAASCIEATMGKIGQCYRTGGDEFVVLAKLSRTQADEVLQRLSNEVKSWAGQKVHSLSLSTGYALYEEHQDLSVEQLIMEADLQMYEAKSSYYLTSGKDRRRSGKSRP